MKICIKTFAAVMAAMTVAGADVSLAQDATPAPGPDEPTTEQVLTASIGCVAAYDMILAQGQAGSDVERMKEARSFAVQVYTTFSERNDADVAADIQTVEAAFPDMLKDGSATLDEFRTTCNAVFMKESQPAT